MVDLCRKSRGFLFQDKWFHLTTQNIPIMESFQRGQLERKFKCEDLLSESGSGSDLNNLFSDLYHKKIALASALR